MKPDIPTGLAPSSRTVTSPTTPPFRLTDPGFVWVQSWQTDVTRIWRKYGWTPPSERKAK